jgi:hypothetical protein
MCPGNKVFVLADPEFVGVMPIRQDIQVIPADKPENLRLGWVIYEEIGVAVVNAMAVSMIDLAPADETATDGGEAVSNLKFDNATL